MSRVLMLARHFPPIGGAGVHRTIGSVHHFPANGYVPVVVTGAADRYGRWAPRDDALLAAVPPGVEVHRVDGEPPAAVSGIGRVSGRPPAWVRYWVRESARLAESAGAGADVIYASCQPYETAFAAARAARALGCPWVADLEDAWALDEMRVFPTRIHRAVELRRMRRALASAAAIVLSAPEAASRLRAAMPELAERIEIVGIPIGYEPDDFSGLDDPPVDRAALRVVHAGSLHTDLAARLRRTRPRRRLLGGITPGLDVLTRTHVFLAEAIDRALDSHPGARIELHLAGALTDDDRAVADRHQFVRVHGELPHRAALELMRSADLLFLPMHDLPRGVRAGLIPYKTYEYLGSRRPILAAVPDGDVRDMLEPLPSATVVRPADAAAMTEILLERLGRGREPDAERPTVYERSHSVARIAAVLDAVRERRTSRTGR